MYVVLVSEGGNVASLSCYNYVRVRLELVVMLNNRRGSGVK